jgi:hypothetical protein
MSTPSQPRRPSSPTSIDLHFTDLPDPRVQRTRTHLLLDIVTIAILAVIAGAKGWDDMETYAKLQEPWLREFLELPGGAPSDDTFRRVFVRLNAKAFAACFTSWMKSLVGSTEGKVIAIDGKTLRGSFNRAAGSLPIHMVHPWATENHVLLGQCATSEKSNEITAIPELLQLLDVSGALVSIDAAGCQKDIAARVVAGRGDFLHK